MVIIKITGVLVEDIVKMDVETYRKYVVFENRKKVTHVVLLISIYLIVVVVLLFYKKLSGDLKNI